MKLMATALTVFAISSAGAANAQPWWWWTQQAASYSVGLTAFPNQPYWNVSCAGIGAHKFYLVAADHVRPNGTSPEQPSKAAEGVWKFSRFLCVVYRAGQTPLIFTLLPGAGQFDYELLPVPTATDTLVKPFHHGR